MRNLVITAAFLISSLAAAEAQTLGTTCETPAGTCQLLSPQTVGSACECPTTTGSVEGVVK